MSSLNTSFSISKKIDPDGLNVSERNDLIACANKAFKSGTLGVYAWKIAQNKSNFTFLAFSKLKELRSLVGFVVASRHPKHLEVEYIAVDKEKKCQRQGLGTRLMKRIFKAAFKEGLQVHLYYNATQKSLCRFYEKFHPIQRDRLTRYLHAHLLMPSMAYPIFDPQASLKAIQSPVDRPGRYIAALKADTELNLIKQVQLILVVSSICLTYYMLMNSFLKP